MVDAIGSTRSCASADDASGRIGEALENAEPNGALSLSLRGGEARRADTCLDDVELTSAQPPHSRIMAIDPIHGSSLRIGPAASMGKG